MRVYALHDSSESLKHTHGAFEISPEDADLHQQEGYGIFQLVNSFDGRRMKKNLTQINYWFAEIDCGEKRPTVEELIHLLLVPSRVVESKNGFHLWFKAKDASLDQETFIKIQRRLRDVYNGDFNAMDISRILRAPGFLHLKDPKSPFLVREVFSSNAEYSEACMIAVLPKSEHELVAEMKANEPAKEKTIFHGDDFSMWIDSQNQMHLIEQLSGNNLVNGNTFRFVKTTGGHYNTITNGKPSAWFIDAQGRIGSSRGSGPTVVQFIQFHGVYTQYKEALSELRKFFGK